MTSVAFLRAINVGGTSVIKMARLAKAFEGMGFANVKTYIQSGNVFFNAPEPMLPLPSRAVERAEQGLRGTLETKIEKALEKEFATAPRVMVRTIEELKRVVCTNPFPTAQLGDNTKLSLYVAFLKSAPSKEQEKILGSFDNGHEQFILAGQDVYCLIRKDVPRTTPREDGVYAKGTFERKLGIPMTIRNYLTLRKMLEGHQRGSATHHTGNVVLKVS